MHDMHKWQGLGSLEITSADPVFIKDMVKCVFPVIPATPTAEELLDSRDNIHADFMSMQISYEIGSSYDIIMMGLCLIT
jgi:hypothetical protein